MQAPLNNRFTGQAKLLLLTVLCFLISYPDAFAAVNKGIRIYQTNAVFGAGHVTVSPDGFRMENTGRLKFILVAKPPSWQVSVFRNDDKTFFTESLTQFEDTGLVSGLISAAKERFIREKNRESTFIWSEKKTCACDHKHSNPQVFAAQWAATANRAHNLCDLQMSYPGRHSHWVYSHSFTTRLHDRNAKSRKNGKYTSNQQNRRYQNRFKNVQRAAWI